MGMRLSKWISAGGFLLASVLVACSSSSTNDPNGASGDGGTTSDAQSDSGVTCCPPDPSPGCCMKYGGAADSSGECAAVCDGMPQPSDPGWKLDTDSYGCPIWTNPTPDFSAGTCGNPPPNDDGGSDSGLDAQGD